MTLTSYLPLIFIGNIFLIFLDATIGYHAAPILARLGGREQSAAGPATIVGVRKLLAAVVALYMFFNCVAYFDQKTGFLLLISVVLLLDIAVQLVVRSKLKSRQGR